MTVIRYANSHAYTFTDAQTARLAEHRRELNDDEVYEFTGFWEDVIAERTPRELANMGVYVIAKREAGQVVVAVDIERDTPGHWLKIGFFVDDWMLGAPIGQLLAPRKALEDATCVLAARDAGRWPPIPGRGEMRAWCVAYAEMPNEQ